MTEPTKLEPLPWFAFNVGDYVKDTMRLTTEAHGAYLLLCLDYYATGEPCPDDDFILAAVAKLPVEAWKNHRKVLAAFFDIREGHWHHNRIEREMRDASVKHSEAVAKTKAATAARWAKDGKKQPEPAAPVARKTRKSVAAPSTDAQPIRDASVTDTVTTSLTDRHIQTHTTTPVGRSSGDDDNAEVSDEKLEKDMGTTINPAFSLRPSQVGLCRADGASDDEISMQVRLFVAFNVERGTFSPNWINTWSLWWTRHLERRAKDAAKAPPRIEVNSTPVSSVHAAPTEAEYDRGVALFAKGMRWSPQLGPEPGQIGCRAPVAIIEKHGLDPKTGAVKRKVSNA